MVNKYDKQLSKLRDKKFKAWRRQREIMSDLHETPIFPMIVPLLVDLG